MTASSSQHLPLYAVSDLRLDARAGGEDWDGHPESVLACWEALVEPDAVTLLAGGITGDRLTAGYLQQLDRLPGQVKVVIDDDSRTVEHLCAHTSTITSVCGRAERVACGDTGLVVCGAGAGSDSAICAELECALRDADRVRRPADLLCVLLRHAPWSADRQPSELCRLLERAGVQLCLYGHGDSDRASFEGNHHGTLYRCTAAERLRMRPLRLGQLSDGGVQLSG